MTMGEPKDPLPGGLQESILAVLAFHDEAGAEIASYVRTDDFDTLFRGIAFRLLEYRWKYKRAPGRAHFLGPLFSTELENRKREDAEFLMNQLNVISAYGRNLNVDFVRDKVADFLMTQALKTAIDAAADRYQQADD